MSLRGSSFVEYTREELEVFTIAQIKAEAEKRGYTINARLKADIIDEFMQQQGGAGND